jgi:hypothetical protein
MPDQEPTMAANPTQSGVSPDCDDMSRDDVIAVPRNRDCDGDMSSLVADIEERIEVLDALSSEATLPHRHEAAPLLRQPKRSQRE